MAVWTSKRHAGQRGHQVAQSDGVAREQPARDERRQQAAQAEEEVQQVEGRSPARLIDVARQSVGAGDDDSAAEPQQEHQNPWWLR